MPSMVTDRQGAAHSRSAHDHDSDDEDERGDEESTLLTKAERGWDGRDDGDPWDGHHRSPSPRKWQQQDSGSHGHGQEMETREAEWA